MRQHVGHTLSVRLVAGEDPQVTSKILGLSFLLEAVAEDVLFEKLTKLAEGKPLSGLLLYSLLILSLDSSNHEVRTTAFALLVGKFLTKFPAFVNKALVFVLNQIGSVLLQSVFECY